jgi:hypothetical protein
VTEECGEEHLYVLYGSRVRVQVSVRSDIYLKFFREDSEKSSSKRIQLSIVWAVFIITRNQLVNSNPKFAPRVSINAVATKVQVFLVDLWKCF